MVTCAKAATLLKFFPEELFAIIIQAPHYRPPGYILLPLTIIAFSIVTGAVLRKVWTGIFGGLTMQKFPIFVPTKTYI